MIIAMSNVKRACKHDDSDVFFYPAINEDGWKCIGCDAKLGFRPDLDDRLLDKKVMGFIHDLHDRKIIYISNGTDGEFIAHNVEIRCRKADRYDQRFIVAAICNDPNVLGDGGYWRKERNRWLMERPDGPPLEPLPLDVRLFMDKTE